MSDLLERGVAGSTHLDEEERRTLGALPVWLNLGDDGGLAVPALPDDGLPAWFRRPPRCRDEVAHPRLTVPPASTMAASTGAVLRLRRGWAMCFGGCLPAYFALYSGD